MGYDVFNPRGKWRARFFVAMLQLEMEILEERSRDLKGGFCE
jgi:hypothetical protein